MTYLLVGVIVFLLLSLTVDAYLNAKLIKALQEREKSWGKYCYISGYLDGRNARKAEPKTQDEVLAEIKEKENADQTF
jgi:hypothetical protein